MNKNIEYIINNSLPGEIAMECGWSIDQVELLHDELKTKIGDGLKEFSGQKGSEELREKVTKITLEIITGINKRILIDGWRPE